MPFLTVFSGLFSASASTEFSANQEIPASLRPVVEAGIDIGIEDAEMLEGTTGADQRAYLVDAFLDGDIAARKWSAEAIVALDSEDWPSDYRGTFLGYVAPLALVNGVEHQVPVSVTLGQAVLESGWGRSSLARRYHNLFGVKAVAGRPSVDLMTFEYGRHFVTGWRVFESWEESIRHHGALLSAPRYEVARDDWTDWPQFIAKIAPVYATDPLYVQRVSSIVRQYKLDRWDDLIQMAVVAVPDEERVSFTDLRQ